MTAVGRIGTLDARVIGPPAPTRRLLVAQLRNGHVLVEGVPGVARTTAVRTLAELLEADFRRIQFTRDLLPADRTGTEVFRAGNGMFEFRSGPVVSSLVLADEIDRVPAAARVRQRCRARGNRISCPPE